MDLVFKNSLAFVLQWEGGYVSDPDDRGGETNKGVTKAVYDAYRRGKGLKLQSVKNITDVEVEDIYRANYYLAAGCDRLPSPLSLVVFDTAVNFGVSWTVKRLQQLLGVREDGILGILTMRAIVATDTMLLARALVEIRKGFRFERVARDSSQAKFLEGWLNRDEALSAFLNKR